jgi:dephospho-CoA kinase
MTVVALTGGVAAGKSTVSNVLARHGVIVIDADILAREAVAPGTPGFEAVIARFGDGVLDSEGNLNRAALGDIVFHDDTARADLNAIVHPRVRELYATAVAAAESSHPSTAIVYAVPLLAEARQADEFAAVVVVDAPAAQRTSRLVEFRGMSADDAAARVLSQASDDERRAMADSVVDASGTVERTERAAAQLAEQLIALWPDRLRELSKRFPLDEA